MGKSETDINKEDKVMLKWNMLQDSLQAKFDGTFEVPGRMGRMSSLQVAAKHRWVHLSDVRKLLHVGQAPIV